MLKFLMTLILAATSGFAQTPSSVQPIHRVGDTLRYTVVFDGDPDFSSVTLFFSTSVAPANQAGLAQSFNINGTKKVGPGKFEVEGMIPNNVVTGSYELSDIQPHIAPNGVKDYDGKKFDQHFEVENPAKYEFPAIKSVKPE
jgi:hypothetical protein